MSVDRLVSACDASALAAADGIRVFALCAWSVDISRWSLVAMSPRRDLVDALFDYFVSCERRCRLRVVEVVGEDLASLFVTLRRCGDPGLSEVL